MSDKIENQGHIFEREFTSVCEEFLAKVSGTRSIPHKGLKGAAAEEVFADFLRQILPKKYSVLCNKVIVDCYGSFSNECDVVVIDADTHFRLFNNLVPVEFVYGIFEVKSHFGAKEAKDFREKASNFWRLNWRGHYTNGMETRLKEGGHHFSPPTYNLLAITTDYLDFERFVAHVYTDPHGNEAYKVPEELNYSQYSYKYDSVCVALDMGCTRTSSIHSWSNASVDFSADPKDGRKKVHGEKYTSNPVKALFDFCIHLQYHLDRKIVPELDHRIYLSDATNFGTAVAADIEKVANLLQKIPKKRNK